MYLLKFQFVQPCLSLCFFPSSLLWHWVVVAIINRKVVWTVNVLLKAIADKAVGFIVNFHFVRIKLLEPLCPLIHMAHRDPAGFLGIRKNSRASRYRFFGSFFSYLLMSCTPIHTYWYFFNKKIHTFRWYYNLRILPQIFQLI